MTYYPKKEYWTDLLNRVQKKSGFSDRLSLDVYRLKLATGNVTTANDYLEMAQLAIQAGLPGRGEDGRRQGLRGEGRSAPARTPSATSACATSWTRRLAESTKARAQAEKDALADKAGNALVALGYNYVTEGAAAEGPRLHGAGHQEGRPQAPRGREAPARHRAAAGRRARAGLQTLKTVQGTDGTADLARLWILLGQRA